MDTRKYVTKSPFLVPCVRDGDEARCTGIFAIRSFAHLSKVFSIYNQTYEHTVMAALEKTFSGSTKEGLLAIGKSLY